MKRWRTALLLVSSATLGGIAVAIWNRRLLGDLRSSLETAADRDPEPQPAIPED
jgi:hypothetical protein